MELPYFVYLVTHCQTSGLFPLFGLFKNAAAVNICVDSVCFQFSVIIPRGRIADSSVTMFNILRNCQTLSFQPAVYEDCNFYISSPILGIFGLFDSQGVQKNLIVVFNLHFSTDYVVEHLLMSLFAIHISIYITTGTLSSNFLSIFKIKLFSS